MVECLCSKVNMDNFKELSSRMPEMQQQLQEQIQDMSTRLIALETKGDRGNSIHPNLPNNIHTNQDTRESIPYNSFEMDVPGLTGLIPLVGCLRSSNSLTFITR